MIFHDFPRHSDRSNFDSVLRIQTTLQAAVAMIETGSRVAMMYRSTKVAYGVEGGSEDPFFEIYKGSIRDMEQFWIWGLGGSGEPFL